MTKKGLKKKTEKQASEPVTLDIVSPKHDTRSDSIELQAYSTSDVCRILSVSPERLREWMIRKFVEPSIQKAKGQGTRAEFSIDDLYRIALFKELIENGFSRETAANYIKLISSVDLEDVDMICIMRNNEKPDDMDIIIANPPFGVGKIQTGLFKGRPDWDFNFNINLEKIKKTVTAKLAE